MGHPSCYLHIKAITKGVIIALFYSWPIPNASGQHSSISRFSESIGCHLRRRSHNNCEGHGRCWYRAKCSQLGSSKIEWIVRASQTDTDRDRQWLCPILVPRSLGTARTGAATCYSPSRAKLRAEAPPPPITWTIHVNNLILTRSIRS